MARIYVSRNIPDEGLLLLTSAGHEVIVNPDDRVLTKKELIAALTEHQPDALLCLLTDTIDDDVLSSAGSKLKIVANYAVGFNNIDIDAAKKRGIIVSNTPGVLTDAVAEHATALIFAIARRVCEADQYAKAGRYKGWGPFLFLGSQLKGKTLGVIGLGRIGTGVAERMVKGMGMRVLYNDRKAHADFEKEMGGEFRSIDDLLAESDVVTIHVPLTEKTRHLINAERLAKMKPSAFLINTARGPIIDEKALLAALEAKRIAGVAIDVLECEPSLDCDPTDHLELKTFPNVIITPHIASATIEARQAMSRIAGENIVAVLSGKDPVTPVG
jgi:glyoxylate reductase